MRPSALTIRAKHEITIGARESLFAVLFIFCPTSKMSHDHSRRGSCSLRLIIRLLHSIIHSLAGDVTAVVVGSGALFGFYCSFSVKTIGTIIWHLVAALLS